MTQRTILFLVCGTLALFGVASSANAFTPGKSSARGDVNGDGRTDNITFRGRDFHNGTLVVKLAGGRTLKASTALITTADAGIVRVANRDGRKGAEVTVRTQHISTCNTYLVFSYRHGDLVRTGRYCKKG